MRVLIGTDGSECSYEAARQFVGLTHGARHDVTVLYVMPRLAVGRSTEYLQIEQEQEALTALNTVRAIFAEAGVAVDVELRQGTPAEAITLFARDGGFDLLVIGSHGKGGFREFLLGKVSKHIVQNAPCSVMIAK